jgi:FHA domain/zinc-ribbon domain
MWRRRRDSAQAGSQWPETAARATSGAGTRDTARRRGSWASRRAWRMDRRGSAQVALSPPPEYARSAVGAGAVRAAVASPISGRPGEQMPSVYCTGCGEPNPEGARFCSQCGTPLIRGQGDRIAETTSTISLGGDLAEEFGDESDADSAAIDALPSGTALLVVRRGPNAGSRFLLDSDLTLVGRHPDSHIFLDDVTVSRRHAEFYRQGGRFTVRDVGSLNGTYVNRERIEEADLSGGDEVQVGKFRLVFLLGPRSAAEYAGGS